MEEIKIANRLIGPNQKPFIIAEMSGNHNQSLEKALEIVDSAAKTGVDALKLQTYTPETMTLDIEEGDFYWTDEGYRCFTEQYHLKRGYCCESGCRHCPYGFDKTKLKRN